VLYDIAVKRVVSVINMEHDNSNIMNSDNNNHNNLFNVNDTSTFLESSNVAESMDGTSEWSFDVTFEFVVHGILINSVGVLGLLGNVVSIVVLSRPQMKSSINTLLIGLVGCDSLLIITSIFMFCFTVFRSDPRQLCGAATFFRRIFFR